MREIEWLPKLGMTAILSGASGSGKSVFLCKLLMQWPEIFPDVPIRRILIIYHTKQKIHERIREFFGDEKCVLSQYLLPIHLEDEFLGPKTEGAAILWLDDATVDGYCDSKLVNSIACAKCHHNYLCCFILVQSLTCSSTNVWRTIRRNANQLFLFSLNRELHILRVLNSQMFGGASGRENLILSAYQMAKADFEKYLGSKFSYLWINSDVNTAFNQQLRTGLLKGEPRILYEVSGL